MWHTHIIMYVHVLIIYNPPLSFREPCKNSQRKAFLEEVHFMSMKKQVFKLFAPFSSIQPPYGYPCKKQYEKTCGIPETNGEFVRKEAISKGKETCLCKKHQKTISWKCWDVDGWNPANHFTGTHYLQSFLFSDRDRCVGPPSTGCSFQRGKASPSMPLGSESMFDSHKAAPFHPRFQHAHKACFMNVPFITSRKKMLADSLPSFIMIFHHPFPEMRFFAKQKNVIPLIHPIPNQLYPTNPPDNTCSHRTELGRGPNPSIQGIMNLLPYLGLGEWMPWTVMTCGPRQRWDIFLGGTERFYITPWTHICFWYISSFLGRLGNTYSSPLARKGTLWVFQDTNVNHPSPPVRGSMPNWQNERWSGLQMGQGGHCAWTISTLCLY